MSNDSAASITSSSSSTATNREMFLKNVNRNSHKIAKPIRKPLLPPSAAAAPPIPIPETNPLASAQTQPQSQQPPVYNINKNDFRDVVQKLTGSPAHERNPTPPPPATHPRSSASSRLQRIRPPPLAQIGNRPTQLTQMIPRPPGDGGQRFAAPPPPPQLFQQPLPPLPSVHPAAESPISAYMRFLQNSASSPAPLPMWSGGPSGGPRPDSIVPQGDFAHRPPFPPMAQPESPVSAYMRFFQSPAFPSSAISPRGSGAPPPPLPPQHPLSAPPQQQPQQHQHQHPPPPSATLPPSPFPVLPLSPLPFGCVPSPKSPYGLLSPSFLFSPTGQLGLPQLPLSPTLPVPSPRWKGI